MFLTYFNFMALETLHSLVHVNIWTEQWQAGAAITATVRGSLFHFKLLQVRTKFHIQGIVSCIIILQYIFFGMHTFYTFTWTCSKKHQEVLDWNIYWLQLQVHLYALRGSISLHWQLEETASVVSTDSTFKERHFAGLNCQQNISHSIRLRFCSQQLVSQVENWSDSWINTTELLHNCHRPLMVVWMVKVCRFCFSLVYYCLTKAMAQS